VIDVACSGNERHARVSRAGRCDNMDLRKWYRGIEATAKKTVANRCSMFESKSKETLCLLEKSRTCSWGKKVSMEGSSEQIYSICCRQQCLDG
jgi:hypothetical protein